MSSTSAHFILRGCVLLASFLAALPSGVAQSIVVDSFADDFYLGVTVGAHTVTQYSLSGALGAERSVFFSSLGAPGSRSLWETKDDLFFHKNDLGARSSVSLEYGKSSPLNADFSSLGAQAVFRLEGWQLDQGSITARLTLTSGRGTADQVTKSKDVVLLATTGIEAVDYFFAFSDFPDVLYRDIDFIGLELINQGTEQNSSLGRFAAYAASIGEVPEPSSYALLVGVIAVCVTGVRRLRTGRLRKFSSRREAWGRSTGSNINC